MTAFLSSTALSVRAEPSRRSSCSNRTVPCATASVSRRSFGSLLAGAASTAVLATLLPSPALADKTMASVRRAYERYYPRIVAGGEFLREIGQSLENGDITAANTIATSKEFDVKFRRALSIYATSLSDSVLSQQSRDLLRCTNKLFDELASFKNAAEVTDDVMQHYKVSTEAYVKYNKIARLPKEMVAGL